MPDSPSPADARPTAAPDNQALGGPGDHLDQHDDLARALLAALPVGIVVYEGTGAMLACNPRAEALLGLTADQLQGHTASAPPWHAIAPDGTPMPETMQPALVALRTGQPQRDVLMGISTPTGRLTWLVVSAEPTRAGPSTGVPAAAVVVSFTALPPDLICAPAAAAPIPAERDVATAIIDTIATLIIVVDRQGHIIRFNPACERLTGYLATEVQGQPFWTLLLRPEDRPAITAVFATAQAGDFPIQHETIWRTRRGEERLIAWTTTAVGAATGEPLYLIGTGQDITERRQLEAEVIAQRDFALQIMDTLGQGLTVTTPDGVFAYVNPAFAQLVEQPIAAILGQPPEAFTLAADHPILHAAHRARQAGETTTYEVHLLRASGPPRPVLVTGAPRREPDGTVVGAITISTDLTQQKQLEAEREQLLAHVQALLERTEAVYQITRTAISETPVAEQLAQMVQHTARVLRVTGVALITLDCVQETVTTVVGVGRGIDQLTAVSYAELMAGLTGWVMQHGQLAYSPGGTADPRESPAVQARRAALGGGALLVAPLLYQGACLGTLTVGNGAEQVAWSPHDAEVVQAIALQMASAVAHARLHEAIKEAAVTDPLTGVANRRGWFMVAQSHWEQAQRQRPLAVVLLDVDRFKQVNDTYGHAVGDQVLQTLAQRCRETVRAMDLVGRYGGEEFVILLPSADAPTAAMVAERIRLAVSNTPVATTAGPLPITVSLGVAMADATQESLAQLLEQADAALYTAKRHGRNQVQVWTTTPPAS